MILRGSQGGRVSEALVIFCGCSSLALVSQGRYQDFTCPRRCCNEGWLWFTFFFIHLPARALDYSGLAGQDGGDLVAVMPLIKDVRRWFLVPGVSPRHAVTQETNLYRYI